jgi:hypothetical protein
MSLGWLIKSISLALALLQSLHASSVLGYRIGDVVDTILVINGSQKSNPFRHQMPIFGANWISYVRFEKSNLVGPRDSNDGDDEAGTISIQFEDGFWAVPTVSLTKNHGSQSPTFLDHLILQFVYSKAGAIHAVLTKDAKYSTDHKSFFHVTYEWIEEEAVSPNMGLAIMFLMVFLFSVYSVLITCGFIGRDLDFDSTTSKDFEGSSRGQSLAVPKCD